MKVWEEKPRKIRSSMGDRRDRLEIRSIRSVLSVIIIRVYSDITMRACGT